MLYGPSQIINPLAPRRLFGYGTGPSSGSSYVGALDNYTTNLAGAFSSVRRLLSSYTGPAINVRRSGGSMDALDIGFVNGVLDTATLTAFCIAGGGTQHGYITKTYDQSGNGRHVAQTTAANQPQIVSGGAVINLNSLPTMDFDGVNDRLAITGLSLGHDFSVYSVFQLEANGTFPMIVGLRDGFTEIVGNNMAGTGVWQKGGSAVNGATLLTGTTFQNTWMHSAATNEQAFLNGSSQGTAAATSAAVTSIDTFAFGARLASAIPANMKLSECIIYTTRHDSTTQAAIENNQKTLFGL